MEALKDPYFDELRNEETRLPNGQALPDLFGFTPEERADAADFIDELIPDWYKAKHAGAH